jgi:cytochrome c peroxidase
MSTRATLSNYAILLLCGMMALSCKKDKESTKGPEGYPAPTPLALENPSYAPGVVNDNPDNPLTIEGVALGRALFFDSTLSKDGTVACVSCHSPQHGFSDPRQFSVGVFGKVGRRNGMALANLRYENHFFWDGRSPSLEDQATRPIQDLSEMGMTPLEVEAAIAKKDSYKPMFGKAFGTEEITFTKATHAIAQYVRSLTSFNSKYDRMQLGTYTPTTEELAGFKLFTQHPYPGPGIRGANCSDCHFMPLALGAQTGFDGFRNNGTSSEPGDDEGLKEFTHDSADFGKFKVPSLRNIALTAPYMHDGRFNTLEEVIDHYNNPELEYRPFVDPIIVDGSNNRFGGGLSLNEDEKHQLIAFLNMLTDTTLARK